MKIRPVGAEFYVDRQTDMTKLVVPFSNSANAPKNIFQLIWKRTKSKSSLYVARRGGLWGRLRNEYQEHFLGVKTACA